MTRKTPPIDLGKTYRTRDGQEVELTEIVPRNSAGGRVTFPVKGAIISISPTGRRLRKRGIWTLSGRWDAPKAGPKDLIEVKEG